MTDTPAAAVPAGWYADTTTPGLMRWWDGTGWTEHTSVPVAQYGMVQQRPLLPADRPIYNPLIWLIVLLPLVSYGLLFAWQPDLSSSFDVRSTHYNPLALYTPAYFVVVGVGWILWGLTVFLAYRDNVWLKRQGVERPFHWAWTFFGGLVYVIGRSVIVRKVAAPRGLTPIWASIGVFVVGIIISIVWSVVFTTHIIGQLPLDR